METAHAYSAEPLRNSSILNENFLRFHLQDKHNASNNKTIGILPIKSKVNNYFFTER